ncbi:MAG: hypothetical protein OXT07_05625 [bacterium]|nr:hypothetical protein [bacterium]
MSDDRGEPDPISRVDYQGHEGRIIKLEEWRKSHEKEHTDHVATEAWVYKVAIGAAAAIATAGASIVVSLVRAFTG